MTSSCVERSRTESESTQDPTRRLSESRGKIERRVRNRTPMPSVGMRRTTRVFGVVKGMDGARVLRSGRRLWPDSGEAKLRRPNDGDEWLRMIKKKAASGTDGCKQNNPTPKQEVNVSENNAPEPANTEAPALGDDNVDKMCGIVYRRKRKRMDSKGIELSDEDKRYGIPFIRRQRRKKSGGTSDLKVGLGRVLAVVVEFSCSGRFWFARFLNSVLRYMKRARLRLSEFSAFVFSEPINSLYSSLGVRFLQDPAATSRYGICKLFGAKRFTPLFSVDFSAVPLCFMYMYSCMMLRSKCLPSVLVNNSVGVWTNGNIMNGGEEDDSFILREKCFLESETVASGFTNSGNCPVLYPAVQVPNSDLSVESQDYNPMDRLASHQPIRVSKLVGRNAPFRNGMNSRGILRRRRSSLRSRRGRNPSLIGVRRPNGALASELVSFRKNGMPFSSLVSTNKLRRSVRSSPAGTFKEVSSTMVGLTQVTDSSRCYANILVIESDKCYREEGAIVMLQISASREWLLVIKRDGITIYTLKAQKDMKPCSCNRFTHAIMWTADDGWKLEFPNRQDWFIFKDLYKECSDRNVPAPSVKIIPVPGVLEVSGYGDSDFAVFSRPDTYITMNDDEVSRAMAKRAANYDMDSEDEEWLKKFNNEFFAENEIHEHVSEERFELMIDVFEKAFHCSPDCYSDEKGAANLCMDLGRREGIEAVYNYWIKKRKQKRLALVRGFQGHQPRRTPLIPKPVLRKQRSFKRQPGQFGRGKQPCVLQAMAAEQDAMEEQNAMIKVEEAKVSANRSMESAVLKRQRAQFLMENADLAIYKAMMAIRIAEASPVAESTDHAATYFLD